MGRSLDYELGKRLADEFENAERSIHGVLLAMSRKASGTPHPAVLSLTTSAHGKIPDLVKEGDNDWVLHVKIGDLAVALIVVGKVEG